MVSPKAVAKPPSALELAALANAMVPGLQALGAKDYVATGSGAIVTIVDDHGKDWQVWSTSSQLSKDSAERLLQVLRLLDGYVGVNKLPFSVPVPTAVLRQKSGFLVLVYPHMGGEPGGEGYLNGGGALASTIGKALGQLHNLPSDAYFEASGQLNTAEENRSQVAGLVEQHSSVLPADLRTRWVGALKDSALWQFDSTPIHGTLSTNNLQVAQGGAVLGVRGFEAARVDDPALDLTWLMYGADDGFLRSFEAAYSRARIARDLHLLTRAQFYAEIETLRWYDQAVQADDSAWRKAGVDALRELDKDLMGELLVAPKEDVIEIKFTAEEEPLLRLGSSTSSASPTGATVAGAELDEEL